MLGLDSRLVTYKFNIKEETKSVKQAPRHFLPELEVKNQAGDPKAQAGDPKAPRVGFIEMIKYPT